VPTIFDFNIKGIEFGFDGLNSFDLVREFSKDAYDCAGITGKREDSVLVPFNRTFAKAFKQLAKLILSDMIIYKNILAEHSESCLMRGDGKLKRSLLRAERGRFGIDDETFDSSSIETLIDRRDNTLSRDDLKGIEKRISSIMKKKLVYDLGQERLLTHRDLVTLVGLMQKVPDFMKDDSRFNGYFMPFGKGVKIIDQDGEIVEYIPYEPYIQIAAQESIYYTVNDISRHNELFSRLFESYAQRVEGDVPVNCALPADDIREEFRAKYGIVIPPRSVKQIKDLRSEYDPISLKGGTKVIFYTLKVGVTEARVILRQLDSLPREIIPDIRQIRREFGCVSSYELFLNDMFRLGEYKNKEITLFTPEEIAFKQFTPKEMQILCDTLQHELGHAIFRSRGKKTRDEWLVLSNAGDRDLTEQQKRNDFMANIDLLRRMYDEGLEFMKWKEEEFCETLAAYVNHGPEFRHMTTRSDVLQMKYDFFRRLLTRFASERELSEYPGEHVEYHGPALVTMDELGRFKTELIGKRSHEEALAMMRQDQMTREELAIANRARVVVSYEQHLEEEDEANNDPDGYDGDDYHDRDYDDYEREVDFDEDDGSFNSTAYDPDPILMKCIEDLMPDDANVLSEDVIEVERLLGASFVRDAAIYLVEKYDGIEYEPVFDELNAFCEGDDED
jgi:hypothetical protein